MGIKEATVYLSCYHPTDLTRVPQCNNWGVLRLRGRQAKVCLSIRAGLNCLVTPIRKPQIEPKGSNGMERKSPNWIETVGGLNKGSLPLFRRRKV